MEQHIRSNQKSMNEKSRGVACLFWKRKKKTTIPLLENANCLLNLGWEFAPASQVGVYNLPKEHLYFVSKTQMAMKARKKLPPAVG